MVTSNPILENLGGNPLAAMQDLANEVRASGSGYFDFAVGDPDEPTPPLIRRSLIQAAGDPAPPFDARGTEDLRDAVAAWLERRHGVTVDPGTEILACAGTKEAVFQLPFALVDRSTDESVIWGAPGYPIYGRGARLAGAVEDRIQLEPGGGWLLDLAALGTPRLSRAKAAWINYPHNPTGATAPRSYFEEQLAAAREHDVVLCSDEAYQDLWYDQPAPSLLEACGDDTRGALAFISLSKRSGMTGYRAGAIVGDHGLIQRLATLRSYSGTVPSHMVQRSAAAAFDDDVHVEQRRELFAAKREVLLSFLEERGLCTSGSQGALYVWFQVPGEDDAAYAKALLAVGVIATPGRAFGPEGEGWVRLALVPTLEQCHRAVEVWGAAIDADRLPS